MIVDLTKLTDKEILALTIIGEARGEPIEGQVAVGSVIRNRLLWSKFKGKRFSDICLAKSQFSCWNEDDANLPFLMDLGAIMMMGQEIKDPSLSQCVWVADGIIDWKILDNTRHADHYLATWLFNDPTRKPKWAKNASNIKVIGRQTFFNV